MKNVLPVYTQKYFWGDDLTQLNWEDHQAYITQTLLDKGDIDAVGWLMNQVSSEELKNQIDHLQLSEKSRNFWEIYLK